MTDRQVAQGADRFRNAGVVEWIGRLGRARLGPAARRWLKRLFYLALRIQTRGRGLASTLPAGEVVRVMPEYSYLTWNPDEYRAFRDVVRSGMIALDIGANVGAYSMVLGQWVGRTGKVFAFEPAPQVFDGLVQHIHLNHLDGVVTPVPSAVGDASTPGFLVLAGTPGESRLATASDRHGATMAVAVTTVDEFCAREGIVPDFIKIDVEGAELAVLRGARETIRSRRGALSLFVEMHPSIWRTLGISAADLLEELRLQGLEPVGLIPADDIWAIDGLCMRLVARPQTA